MVVSLTGTINGRLMRHSLEFSFKDSASDLAPVHRLAAKAAIKQLEEDGKRTKDPTVLKTWHQ